MRLFVRSQLERAARIAARQFTQYPSKDTEAIVWEAVSIVAEEGEPVYTELDIKAALEVAAAAEPVDLPSFVLQYLRQHS
jgi:hypothetical protein